MSRTGGSTAGPPGDEHCRAKPAEQLRPYVACYVGYRQRGVPPARDPEGNRWSFGTCRGEPRKG